MEAEALAETLDETLARLMFKMDVPLKMREHEREWDPTGDGTITKGACPKIVHDTSLRCAFKMGPRLVAPVQLSPARNFGSRHACQENSARTSADWASTRRPLRTLTISSPDGIVSTPEHVQAHCHDPLAALSNSNAPCATIQRAGVEVKGLPWRADLPPCSFSLVCLAPCSFALAASPCAS